MPARDRVSLISKTGLPLHTTSIGGNHTLDVNITGSSVTFTGTEDANIIKINGTTALAGNGVTGAGSLRVTIASDNSALAVTQSTSPWVISFTAPQHVILDSGTLTTLTSITNAVTVAQATASSLNATVVGTGTFAVQATIAASATNIAKAEDVASADADVGVPAMAIRKATPVNTSGTDGDYEMLQINAGRLWVDPSGVTLTVASHAVTNAGTFAVQAAITAASGSISSGAFASGSVASGAVASGAFASGAIASGAIVAGAIAAGASSFVKLEDVASADADAGVACLAVRKATPANTSGSDGDYEFLQINSGRLWTSATIDAALPAGTNVIGHVITDTGSTTAVTGTVTTKDTRSSTATHSNVSASATNVTLLASNANRLGASVYNDSTAILYLKLAATATTSSFTTKLFADDYYEVPFGYTGIIDGIWASATGAASVVEET